jgi:hypothetical protein
MGRRGKKYVISCQISLRKRADIATWNRKHYITICGEPPFEVALDGMRKEYYDTNLKCKNLQVAVTSS